MGHVAFSESVLHTEEVINMLKDWVTIQKYLDKLEK